MMAPSPRQERTAHGKTLAGAKLWQDQLPAGGQATPMTCEGAGGCQYLVVVAGGHGSTGTQPGDYVIAYALPA
jgi:quinoprotein glucose dehydrogenase